MTVDPRTGTVTLDGGWCCEPERSRQSLLGDTGILVAPIRESAPYRSYRVREMEASRTDLELVLAFEGQRLTRIEFDECDPDAEAAPTSASEARRQRRFLTVLEASLGRPHAKKRVPTSAPDEALLGYYFTWKFKWGEAWCGAHPKDGYVSAGIGYTWR